MIKYVFTVLLLLSVTALVAQRKSTVKLISSVHSQGTKRNGVNVIKVYQGVFKQENSTLRSDSAYFYPDQNLCDAYGHVNINQGDTLNIYSDKLNYNGNTHVALLTDNVRMVDKDATLTTNYLTYNTATRIGTYTGGGKLVNKDNTLTSTNGYYFAVSRDAYFRYNVVLNTVDAVIKNDTLRYNTGTRISYFYGPTHIYGKKNKDTLYTENGTYNTVTEQAFFGKKNLYTQNTKSLKGDSLFYDRLKGFGRAIKNVVFNDNEQKMTLHGDIGTYTEKGEKTMVTRNPWVTIITEDKDTTRTDSVTAKPDSVAAKVGSVKKDIKLLPVIKPTPGASPVKDVPGNKSTPVVKAPAVKPAATVNTTEKQKTKTDSAAIKPDAVKKDVNPLPATKPGINTKAVKVLQGKITNDTKQVAAKPGPITGTNAKQKTKTDTIYLVADTLETQMLTYKAFKDMLEQRRLASVRDTTKAKKAAAPVTSTSKFLIARRLSIQPDTTYRHTNFFGPPKKSADNPVVKKPGSARAGKRSVADSLKRSRIDSVNIRHNYALSDTSRIRILTGHFNAKIFKSDLQAKADSIFYSSSDSTIRCFVKPMMWSQGSQMSGDTLFLQLRNRKLDNVDVFPNSFIVNIENNDTTHFNQVGGKKMKGFFVNDKLNRMFVDGNAESIYYQRDSTGKVTNMERSLSSRIRVNFKDNKAMNILNISKPEHRVGPPEKFKEEDRMLKGFIWKPHDRPESKEQIIPALDKTGKYRKERQKAAQAKSVSSKTKPGTGKPASPATGKATDKTVKDSTNANPPKLLNKKPVSDSVNKAPGTEKLIPVKRDTAKKM